MHTLGKILIGISVVSIVAILGYLGFEVVPAIIALTKGLALTTAQFGGFVGIGRALGIVITSFSVNVIFSLWQASKNKEKLTDAITEANKALKEIDNKIKNIP